MSLAILASLIISFVATVTTVSVCFLGDLTADHPEVCKIIPGYDDSQRQNKLVFIQFEQLRHITSDNKRRIERLEALVKGQVK